MSTAHTDVVELLLEHKSNIEHRNKAGCTPLMLASRYVLNSDEAFSVKLFESYGYMCVGHSSLNALSCLRAVFSKCCYNLVLSSGNFARWIMFVSLCQFQGRSC